MNNWNPFSPFPWVFFPPLGDGAENGEATDTFGAGSVRIGGWSLMVVNGGKCSLNGWLMVGWMVNEVVTGCGWSHPPFCGEQIDWANPEKHDKYVSCRKWCDPKSHGSEFLSLHQGLRCCCNDASCWGNDEFMVLFHRGFIIDPDSWLQIACPIFCKIGVCCHPHLKVEPFCILYWLNIYPHFGWTMSWILGLFSP